MMLESLDCEGFAQCGNGRGKVAQGKAAATRAINKDGKNLTPAEQEAWDKLQGREKVQPKLPAIVTEKEFDGFFMSGTSYSFNIAGKELEVMYDNEQKGRRNVLFMVDNDFNMGTFAPKSPEAKRSAVVISKIQQYDASKQPDGTIYKTNAYTRDGDGARRARGFSVLGFSAAEKPGDDQYGVVKNGRLIPSDKNGNPIQSNTKRGKR